MSSTCSALDILSYPFIASDFLQFHICKTQLNLLKPLIEIHFFFHSFIAMMFVTRIEQSFLISIFLKLKYIMSISLYHVPLMITYHWSQLKVCFYACD